MNSTIKILYEEAIIALASKEPNYFSEDDMRRSFVFSERIKTEFPEPYKFYAGLIGRKIIYLASLMEEPDCSEDLVKERIDATFKSLLDCCGLMYARYKLED